MSDTEAGSLAEWLMSGEPPKTHEQRVWWHEYKTHDGIKEHAERIAILEELVLDMWEGYNDPRCEECHLKDTPTCADCPICAREASVIDRMRELGLEVE